MQARFLMVSSGFGGCYPKGERCNIGGQEGFLSSWDGSYVGVSKWSRLDFQRPASDWENADWDEVTRHMPAVTTMKLAGMRASSRAAWMEALVGSAYHLCTQGRHLPNQRFELQAEVAMTVLLPRLQAVCAGLSAIGIDMPGCLELV